SVKPASRASPTLTAPTVSIWVTLTVAAPDVSARLEKAYRFALWNSGPNSEYSLVVTKIPSRSAPMWGKSPMQAVGWTTRGACPPVAQPWFGVPFVPSSVTSTRKTSQLPSGDEVALTARSRWFVPVKAPLSGKVSSVSHSRNQRRVAWSKMQLGSVTNGPRTGGVTARLTAGG